MDFIKKSYFNIKDKDLFKFYALIVILLVGVEIIFSSWFYFRGDIYYNEDIARDLLILENIVTEQPLTLIGPRILAIGGFFHGPLWIYLNLPAYLIGQGNPIVMGAFWILLYISLLVITYFIAKKIFDSTVGLFSVLLLSSTTYPVIFTNTYGALLVFPIFFYCINVYIKNLNVKYLIASFILIGLLIQFEIAFGGPILVTTLIYLFYFLYKKKKIYHLLSLVFIAIPLSTYLVFDLRHDFLQTRAVINYLTFQETSDTKIYIKPLIIDHFSLIYNSSIQMIVHSSQILKIIFISVFSYLLLVARKTKHLNYPRVYIFFLVLYLGFWFLSLLYRGNMWMWYYYEFIPVMIMLFASAYRLINKKLFIIIFLLFFIVGMNQKIAIYQSTENNFIGKSNYSWQLYSQIANEVLKDAPDKFGYFISEHDLLGYRSRYAMHYFQKKSSKTGYENSKYPTTYLILEEMVDNEWWKKNKANLDNRPVRIYNLNNLYVIEKHQLSEQETLIPPDSSIINNLFFR